LFEPEDMRTNIKCLYRNEICFNHEIYGTEKCGLCLKGQTIEVLMTIASHLDVICMNLEAMGSEEI